MGLFGAPWKNYEKWRSKDAYQQINSLKKGMKEKDILEVFHADGTNPVLKEHLVKGINDQGELVKIVTQPGDSDVRSNAALRVEDVGVVLGLLADRDAGVRLHATLRLTDFEDEAAKAALREISTTGDARAKVIAGKAIKDPSYLNLLKIRHQYDPALIARDLVL